MEGALITRLASGCTVLTQIPSEGAHTHASGLTMPCFFAVRVLAQTESKFASVGRFSGVSSTEAKKTKPKIQKIKLMQDAAEKFCVDKQGSKADSPSR
jgi:hypothetical protein